MTTYAFKEKEESQNSARKFSKASSTPSDVSSQLGSVGEGLTKLNPTATTSCQHVLLEMRALKPYHVAP
jgi:hypothetical protein